LPSPPKYERLKQDPKVNLWFQNHKKTITAKGDLRRLGLFCEMFNTTPQNIVQLAQPPQGSPLQAKEWIIEKVVALQSPPYSFKGNYVANFVKSLISWLGDGNGISLPEKPQINIKGRGKNKKYAKEKPPTPQEVQLLLQIGDTRQQVTASLIAFSGFRPRTLGNDDGTDGLTVGDFPEMHVDYEKHTVTFDKYPTRIMVREEINKGEDRKYETFLNKTGCDTLRIYLEDRMTPKPHRVYDSNGKPVRDQDGKQLQELRAEKLTPDSPIVGHTHPYQLKYTKDPQTGINYYTETFVPAQNISYAILSPVIKKLGLKLPTGEHDRGYILRSYFDNRMMAAEADKQIGVIYSWRQLWMGHTEGIEAVYTTNKTIPDDIVEQMRKAYEQASDAYLTIPKTRLVSIEEASNEYKRMYLVQYGEMTEQEAAKLGDLSRYSFQQLKDMVEKSRQAKRTPTRQRQTEITLPLSRMNEIHRYQKRGWRITKELSNKHVVLEMPPAPEA
jgi:hypothetical protein